MARMNQNCRECGKRLDGRDLKYKNYGEHYDDTTCIRCGNK